MGPNFTAGMLSVLDPTGRVLPARPSVQSATSRTFDEGVEALIAALSVVEAEEEKASEGGARGISDTHRPLSKLRITAVTGSFLCAVSTLVLCTIAMASDTAWPLIAVSAISASATLAIALFFAVLRWTLARQALALKNAQAMRAVLRQMAESKVADLETKQLLRLSQDNPELANAILGEIMTEYTDAEQSPGRHSSQGDGRGISVEHLMQAASVNHVVARTLRRLASDVSEARTSDVSEAR
ncbi:hypothetical protein [Streptomyces sp. NPDC002994]|uniref:hypothetical protein n=1 Tax=Streptomyces sp. NPDC002994 TaxID=3154441 RepID=UPI0033A588CF